MCIICVDFEKGRLTTREARRALGEMSISLGPAHTEEVEKKLEAAEQVESNADDPAQAGPNAP
jgi:hypothetical protein